MKRPKCYFCNAKSARKGSLFCSQKCAALWADEILPSYELDYCFDCKKWDLPEYHKNCCETIIAQEWIEK